MDTVALLNRTLTDRYRVERQIGVGGMASVYLARDARHDRPVALKVLKPDIAAVLGVERFLSEIRITANLQHPNLLPLFDSGEAEGMLFYVMPYVEGESLRARLERERQLPIDEAVRIAVAVASALEFAHGRGVIHRDLKPENILLQGGEPMVADFGIALAVAAAGGARVTQTGVSLGTPQYMSPEQATGDRAVDARSDIYSLAAVTYEMIAGEPAHSGGTVQNIISRVVTEAPPDIRTRRASVPEHVAAAIEQALEKIPADRFSGARQFSEALRGSLTASRPLRGTRSAPWPARTRDPVVLSLAAIAALGVLTAGLTVARTSDRTQSQPVRFSINTEGPALLQPFTSRAIAIAPGGRAFVFSGRGRDERGELFLRRLDGGAPEPIPGTSRGRVPFFSPDGAWIGFFVGNTLMRVATAGGTPLEVADLSAFPGDGNANITWTRRGEIVYSAGTALITVPAAGGAPRRLLSYDSTAEWVWANPRVLGDDNTVVLASVGRDQQSRNAQLVATTLDAPGRPSPIGVTGLNPLGELDGHLVYLRADGSIMAVPFDRKRRRATGAPVQIETGAYVVSVTSVAGLSSDGTLAFASGGRDAQLVWADMKGRVDTLLGGRRFYDIPRLSPDGNRVALYVSEDGGPTGDLWVYELNDGTLIRLTRDSASWYGEWLPDSRTLLYVTRWDSASALVAHPVDGSGPRTVVARGRELRFTVSRDGSTLVIAEAGSGEAPGRLVMRRLRGDTSARVLVGYTGEEDGFRLSPDGRWLAYRSTESGSGQVYIRPFPGPGPRVQVTTNGGGEPVWSRDGKRLYYRTGPVFAQFNVAGLSVEGNTLRIAGRTRLFEGPYDADFDFAAYDVSADGTHLLAVRFPERGREIVVTLNWRERLRRSLAR